MDDGLDMIDLEMLVVDEKFVEIFRYCVKVISKKKENKDVKEIVINFKYCVFDMLGIFVKKEFI